LAAGADRQLVIEEAANLGGLTSWALPKPQSQHFRLYAAEHSCIVGKQTFAGRGATYSAQSPPTSWDNRNRYTADPDFVCLAWHCPQFGTLSSPASQPAVSLDSIGSMSSTTRWWMCSQAGYSNVRMSKPAGPAVMRANMVLAWRAGQRGRRMIMMLRHQAGAQHSQSPIDADKGR
jgi:hypothetical protein